MDRTSAIVSALEKLADNLPGDDGVAQATIRDAAERLDELNSIYEQPCHWRLDADYGDVYDGTCGVRWAVLDGVPEDCEMHFCPCCGGRMVVEGG